MELHRVGLSSLGKTPLYGVTAHLLGDLLLLRRRSPFTSWCVCWCTCSLCTARPLFLFSADTDFGRKVLQRVLARKDSLSSWKSSYRLLLCCISNNLEGRSASTGSKTGSFTGNSCFGGRWGAFCLPCLESRSQIIDTWSLHVRKSISLSIYPSPPF